MSKKILTLVSALALIVSLKVSAQDASEALVLSGSVDTYYKYDFSAPTGGTSANIGGYGDIHNAFSLGMFNLIATQTVGKATFVGDIAFGPRNQGSTPALGAEGAEIGFIQNLYASYAFSDAVTFTMGFMGTHLGYEVISPTGNFNYTTSYLFGAGPFNTAGAKLDFALSDKFNLMIGVFNNGFGDQGLEVDNGKALGVQLNYAASENADIYLNLLSDPTIGTEIDLTAGFQLSDDFYLGVNAATLSEGDGESLFSSTDDTGFSGIALYPQYSISDATTLGLRLERFGQRNADPIENANFTAVTITTSIAAGPLTFIPELRFDSSNFDLFEDSDGAATSSASQFLFAMVYGF